MRSFPLTQQNTLNSREKKKQQAIWGCQSGLLINQLIMESIERKIKEEDRYVLLYDESLNQQLKKTSWTSKLY